VQGLSDVKRSVRMSSASFSSRIVRLRNRGTVCDVWAGISRVILQGPGETHSS
jgi:hypothetical protein